MSQVQMSRQALYDEVWSTPMVKVARKYGLSDVGLAKICRKHDIPRPPRGYWAIKQHGKAPPQPPLPNNESSDTIQMRDPDDARIASPELRQEVEAKVAQEADEGQKIEVSDTLRGSHKLVSAANAALQRAPTDEDGLIDPSETDL